MNGPDVEQAILSVKAGNIEEYRTVVVVFHHRLRAAIAGLCPPGVEAEEIAHCAFIEAYRRIDQYQPGTNFFAWLSSIARNQLRAEFEKIRRRARNKENYLGHVVVQQLDRAATEEPELLAVRHISSPNALLSSRRKPGRSWRCVIVRAGGCKPSPGI